MKKLLLFILLALSISAMDLKVQKAKFDKDLERFSKLNKVYNMKIVHTFQYKDDDQPYYIIEITLDKEPARVLEIRTMAYSEVLISFSTTDITDINQFRLEYYDEKGRYDY